MEEEKHNDDHVERMHRLMEDIRAQMSQLQQMVEQYGPVDEQRSVKTKAQHVGSVGGNGRGKVIEGVFDGQNMVGPDGKVYTVPANYASKSKLVEGDIMKLTITADGSFIYKQIGPVERARQMGTLVRDDETGMYRALTKNGRSFRLLTASVTYYKGEVGDTVVLLLPEEMDSRWAAIDNVVKGVSVEEAELLDDGAHSELPAPHAELPLGDEMELPAPRMIPRITTPDDPNDESYFSV
jgi:hypothetical protein